MKKFRALIIDFLIILIVLVISIVLVVFGKIRTLELAIIFILIYVINAICVFYLMIKNDNFQEKLSWIFFLVTFPIISHIFFGLFRIRRITGKSIIEYEKELSKFDDKNLSLNLETKNDLEKKYKNITNRWFYKSNFEFYNHGFIAYEKLFQDIEKAKKFIHIEMYIIKPSETYESLKNLLIKKAKEGVEIKIIVDDFGTWLITNEELKYLVNNGIKIIKFNKTFYPIVKPTDNNRLHRKFFIIDGKIVHSGGLNISDEYASYSSHYGYWADLNFKIKGEIIHEYQKLFLYDWFSLSKEKLNINDYFSKANESKTNSRTLFIDQGPNNNEKLLERIFINQINRSNNSIRIATPYFVPTNSIMNSLKFALQMGTSVEIFIPGKPDKKLVYHATKFFANELSKLGAKIYVMDNIFLHSKITSFDECVCVGTNNLDIRSFFTNYEMMNIILGKEVVEQMNLLFDSYKKNSKLSKPITHHKYWYNFKKFMFNLLSPLL